MRCSDRRTRSTPAPWCMAPASANFVATEETLCFLLPKETILELVKKNQAFAAFFYSDLSRRLDAFAEQKQPQQGLDSVLRARVKDARRGKAVFIDGAATIEEAGHAMTENLCSALFVKDGGRTGIVTFFAMSKAVILEQASARNAGARTRQLRRGGGRRRRFHLRRAARR